MAGVTIPKILTIEASGISFTFVSVFCYIGPTYGYNAILAMVFLVVVIQNLVLPKNMEAAPQAGNTDKQDTVN